MTVIITPEQRLAEPRGARILILGPNGVGKTSLLRTLDPNTAIFADIEHGSLAIDALPVPHVRPETWPEIRDLIVRIAGPNRSFAPHEPYSQAHFDRVGGHLPDRRVIRSSAAGKPPCSPGSKPVPSRQPPRVGMPRRIRDKAAAAMKRGDYVVATKYADGDPGDQFCIGFYDGFYSHYGQTRHLVIDNEGKNFRANGFRCVAKVGSERGKWMALHVDLIERMRNRFSIWHWYRAPWRELKSASRPPT